jgi:predicted dehydrogenase
MGDDVEMRDLEEKMSDKAYKVMVTGLGKRGMHHAQAFSRNPRFEIAGFCSRSEEKLAKAAAEFGNPPVGADPAELAARVKPDLFCFATPPSVRLSLFQIGADCGAKLIAYEKPMSLSLAEARQIRDLARKTGVKSVVSHQQRYGEHYRKVKEIIASGEIGRVHTVYGTAVGYLMQLLSHLIDYMGWFNGDADADWVMAQAAGRSKFSTDHPSPDYLAGFIQYQNGVRGIVETGGGAPDVPEVDYWWRKNRIGAQGTLGFAETLTNGGWRAVTPNGVRSGPGAMDYEADMAPYVEEMALWLDDDANLHPCNGENAYQGMEIMAALIRSATHGGQVALPLPDGPAELDELAKVLPDRPVRLTFAESLKEYPDGIAP